MELALNKLQTPSMDMEEKKQNSISGEQQKHLRVHLNFPIAQAMLSEA